MDSFFQRCPGSGLRLFTWLADWNHYQRPNSFGRLYGFSDSFFIKGSNPAGTIAQGVGREVDILRHGRRVLNAVEVSPSITIATGGPVNVRADYDNDGGLGQEALTPGRLNQLLLVLQVLNDDEFPGLAISRAGSGYSRLQNFFQIGVFDGFRNKAADAPPPLDCLEDIHLIAEVIL